MDGERQPLPQGPQSLAQCSLFPMKGAGPTPTTLVEPGFLLYVSLLPHHHRDEQVCFHGNHTVTQGFGTFSEPDYEYQMLSPCTNAE